MDAAFRPQKSSQCISVLKHLQPAVPILVATSEIFYNKTNPLAPLIYDLSKHFPDVFNVSITCCKCYRMQHFIHVAIKVPVKVKKDNKALITWYLC